ncbi:ribonuclease E inhibitor RraB [Roseibium sp. RKSG952]|uniref:ribonuclease E inhibitor RraB n=1 Tax=Roseibium sp. RKSG952 TaxID=2529384 RepID=UPI0012BC848B|nr:ribonuclease E inhibitor RraB [Roseibium sp. RKSG952]
MKSLLRNIHARIVDQFFKPSNAQMLSSAADQGVDLSEPIPFTFYISFRNSDDADGVAAMLESKGYKITRETEEEDPYPYEVEAETKILGNENEVTQQEDFFRTLVSKFPARYDDYSITYSDEEAVFY